MVRSGLVGLSGFLVSSVGIRSEIFLLTKFCRSSVGREFSVSGPLCFQCVLSNTSFLEAQMEKNGTHTGCDFVYISDMSASRRFDLF